MGASNNSDLIVMVIVYYSDAIMDDVYDTGI